MASNSASRPSTVPAIAPADIFRPLLAVTTGVEPFIPEVELLLVLVVGAGMLLVVKGTGPVPLVEDVGVIPFVEGEDMLP